MVALAARSSSRLERLRREGVLARCGHDFAPRVFDHGGVRQAYVDEGAGPAVVMVHGNPTWSFYYRHLVRRWRDRHRCIVPDHVGCGFSDTPPDGAYDYTLESRIADLSRLLGSLGLERPITLVVHDWGGPIGLGWAVRHPGSVARLIVMNTAGFHLPRGKPLPGSLRLCRDSRLGEALVRGLNAFSWTASRVGTQRGPLPADVRLCYEAPYDGWAARIAVARFVQDIPLEPSDRAHPVLSEIEAGLPALATVPTQLFWGLRDFVFDGDYLDEWRRRLPAAEVHAFPDAGHYVLEDAADEIAARALTAL